MDTIVGIFIIVLVVTLYFLPTIIAGKRNHPHDGTIFALNLLLGWTFIVWIVLLIWAIFEKPPA